MIATHLAEVVRRHAHEVLTRQETKRLLDSLSETQPKLVEELVPRVLSLGEIEKILQQLLREQVSIRDLPTILETLIDASAANRSMVALVEAVRQALGRALVQPLLQDDGKLKVLALDPAPRGRNQPRVRAGRSGRASAGAANRIPAPRSRRTEARGRGTDRRRVAGRAVRQPGAFSSAATARAFCAAHRGAVAGGNSAGGIRAIDRSSAMTRRARNLS